MAIPNRSKQIEAVAAFLESPSNDERTVSEVARLIVDGIYDMWTRGVESTPFPLVVGKAFKTPMVAKVHHVAWIGEAWWNKEIRQMVWVISPDSDYGTLTPYDSPIWRIVTPSSAKAGAPGASKAGWKPGDLVSHSQRSFKYEILQVGDKCNLLRRIGTDDIQAESSSVLEKLYQRESK